MSTGLTINQYTIQEKIGDGGMAEVFLAYDNDLEKYVAIKRLKPEFVNSSNVRGRFIAEARSMFSMNHPNVVKVHGLLEEEGFVGAAMEFVPGQTLDLFIESKKVLSYDMIRELLLQMIEALNYVHKVGLIHRDIKPSNFMVDENNNVKLLDFGIAKNLNEQFYDYTRTGTNQQMGTPLYMSPEQVVRPDKVTQLTDIYSLGVVIYFLVKGESPYDKTTVSLFELQSKIVHEKLPLTNTIWDRIINRATEKDPKNRFQSVDEVLNAVQKLRMNDTVIDYGEKTQTIIGRTINVLKPKKSKRKLVFLGSLVAVVLILIGVTFSLLESDEEKIASANSVVTSFAKDLDLDSRNEQIYPGIKKMGKLYYLRDFKITSTEINENGTITVFGSFSRLGNPQNVKFTIAKQNGKYVIKESRGVSGYYDSPLMTYCINKGYLKNFNEASDKQLSKICSDREFEFNFLVQRVVLSIPEKVHMEMNSSNLTNNYGYYLSGHVTIVNTSLVNLPMGSVSYTIKLIDRNNNVLYSEKLSIRSYLLAGDRLTEDVFINSPPRGNFRYLVYVQVIDQSYLEVQVAKNPFLFE